MAKDVNKSYIVSLTSKLEPLQSQSETSWYLTKTTKSTTKSSLSLKCAQNEEADSNCLKDKGLVKRKDVVSFLNCREHNVNSVNLEKTSTFLSIFHKQKQNCETKPLCWHPSKKHWFIGRAPYQAWAVSIGLGSSPGRIPAASWWCGAHSRPLRWRWHPAEHIVGSTYKHKQIEIALASEDGGAGMSRADESYISWTVKHREIELDEIQRSSPITDIMLAMNI